MKIIKLMLLSVTIATAITGCSVTKTAYAPPVFTAGGECAGMVLDGAKGKIGTTNFTSVFLDDQVVIKAGDSAQEAHHIQGIPYAESSALDNGTPGSAWHNCMKLAGFPI